nr:poly(ADP-ribose) glycohydrolase isoform X2 [Nothobranchius furzeri]
MAKSRSEMDKLTDHDNSQTNDLISFEDNQHNENRKPDLVKQQSSDSSSAQASSSAGSSSDGCSTTKGNKTKDKDTELGMLTGEDSLSDCQLSDLKKFPQHDVLAPLKFNKSHTVLINVHAFTCEAKILPQDGRDLWHSDFVKMPCSPTSTATTRGLIGTNVVKRWELIDKQLKSLASLKSVKVDRLEEAILNYNPAYKGKWSFDALSSLVKQVPRTDNYFEELFPKIAALALKLPHHVKKAIPLLQRGHHAAITLSQLQIACLLANAFLCTFPHRNTQRPEAEYHNYPSINFNKLFGYSKRKKEKLRAIMHYFRVVTQEESKPNGLVTFERFCIGNSEKPNWGSCEEKLQKLHVTSQGSIEKDGIGMLQVDFANSLIGGGVLDSGLLQEEILFLMNPELIVSRLFTEKLADNECLIITGSQQFSSYSGYSDNFEWTGPYEDQLDRDHWHRLKRQILAIDALHFRNRRDQYNMSHITRELNKAYCGFKKHHKHEEPDIATGKWGCGAFGGDAQLKALIQLMAAAKAGRGLAFFTFQDKGLTKELQEIYHLLTSEGTTVGKLFKLLDTYCTRQRRAEDSSQHLFDFIRLSITPSRSQL